MFVNACDVAHNCLPVRSLHRYHIIYFLQNTNIITHEMLNLQVVDIKLDY